MLQRILKTILLLRLLLKLIRSDPIRVIKFISRYAMSCLTHIVMIEKGHEYIAQTAQTTFLSSRCHASTMRMRERRPIRLSDSLSAN